MKNFYRLCNVKQLEQDVQYLSFL